MKIFNFRFKAITQAEVIIALVILSLVILASKNITTNKLNYASRVKARAAYQVLNDFASEAVTKGFTVDDNHFNFIPPYYKPTDTGLPPSVSVKGGLLHTLLGTFNTLKDTEGTSNTECLNTACSANGHFTNIPPTLTLSNGMTMYISGRAFSYGMMTVPLASNYARDFNDLFLSSYGGFIESGDQTDQDGDKVKFLNRLCDHFPNGKNLSARDVAAMRNATPSDTGDFFANIAECPWCSFSADAPIQRREAIEIFNFLYTLQYGAGGKNNNFKIGSCASKSFPEYIEKTWSRFINGSYYQVFIDTDGPKAGSNTLDDDVIEFYLTLSGTVIPISDLRLFNPSGDAIRKSYLYANLRYELGALIPNSPFPLIRAMCHYNYATGTNYSFYGPEENLENETTSFNILPIPGVCAAGDVTCNNCKEPELIKMSFAPKARK